MDDIINTDGKFISIRDVNDKFNINVIILNYYPMKVKIELYMSKQIFRQSVVRKAY